MRTGANETLRHGDFSAPCVDDGSSSSYRDASVVRLIVAVELVSYGRKPFARANLSFVDGVAGTRSVDCRDPRRIRRGHQAARSRARSADESRTRVSDGSVGIGSRPPIIWSRPRNVDFGVRQRHQYRPVEQVTERVRYPDSRGTEHSVVRDEQSVHPVQSAVTDQKLCSRAVQI